MGLDESLVSAQTHSCDPKYVEMDCVVQDQGHAHACTHARTHLGWRMCSWWQHVRQNPGSAQYFPLHSWVPTPRAPS